MFIVVHVSFRKAAVEYTVDNKNKQFNLQQTHFYLDIIHVRMRVRFHYVAGVAVATILSFTNTNNYSRTCLHIHSCLVFYIHYVRRIYRQKERVNEEKTCDESIKGVSDLDKRYKVQITTSTQANIEDIGWLYCLFNQLLT